MSIPVFKPSNNLFSYFSCKVTTRIYNFKSVMLNFKSSGVLIASILGSAIGSSPAANSSLTDFSVNTQF